MKASVNNGEPVHLGNNVKRIREMLGIKQYALAEECKWTQQHMSKLENSETLDDEHLVKIAKGLGLSKEFIKNFKEERAIYYIQTSHDNSSFVNMRDQNTVHIHSVDKIGGLLEKFIRDEQQKSQSLTDLGKVVLDLVNELKKLQK